MGSRSATGRACLPADEVCDGLDNDCVDGIDSGNPGGGAPCDSGELGECAAGTQTCVDADIICVANDESAEELCNGLDDDCDGSVDEAFDLKRDPLHCGGCGTECVVTHGQGVCHNGVCAIRLCDDHWFDDDVEYDSGCELEVAGDNGTIHVDPDNDDDPDSDGTEEHPWPLLSQALAQATPGDIIELDRGTYAGPIDLRIAHLTLRGERRGQVVIEGVGGEFAVRLNEDHVRLETVTVDANGAHCGVIAQCGLGCRVMDVAVSAAVGTSAPEGQFFVGAGFGAGLDVRDAEAPEIYDNEVEVVRGGQNAGEACYNGYGGEAAGIRVVRTTDARVVGNTVSDVVGGAASTTCGNVSRPAAGIGIAAWDVEGGVFIDNVVEDVTGGAGGGGGRRGGDSHNGAHGIGFHLMRTAQTGWDGNTADDLSGGAPGQQAEWPAHTGYAGSAFGLWIDDEARESRFERTNAVGGAPLVYVYGEPGAVVRGLSVASAINSTNLGKAVVLESPGAVIEGNRFVWFRGAAGRREQIVDGHAAAEVGQTVMGLFVEDSPGVIIRDNDIQDLVAGRGGSRQGIRSDQRDGVRGGHAYGIWIAASDEAILEGNSIRRVTGGEGGISGSRGDGGWAYGIWADAEEVAFTGNDIAELQCGLGHVCGGAIGYHIRGRGSSVTRSWGTT